MSMKVKTQLNSTVKTAIIIWTAGIILALAIATISARQITSGSLTINKINLANEVIQIGTKQTQIFALSFHAEKEPIKVNSIKFTFVAPKGVDGKTIQKNIRNVKLYKRASSPDSQGTYNLTPVSAGATLTARNQIATASPRLTSPITILPNNTDVYVVAADIPNIPTTGFNFSVQIANKTDIKAIGTRSKRTIVISNNDANYAKGDWVEIQGTSKKSIRKLSITSTLDKPDREISTLPAGWAETLLKFDLVAEAEDITIKYFTISVYDNGKLATADQASELFDALTFFDYYNSVRYKCDFFEKGKCTFNYQTTIKKNTTRSFSIIGTFSSRKKGSSLKLVIENMDIKGMGQNSKTVITSQGTASSYTFKIPPPDNCDISSKCASDLPSGWLDFYFKPDIKYTKIEANFNWIKLPRAMDVGIYAAVIYNGFEYEATTLYSGPQIILENGQTTRKILFSIWDAWDDSLNTAIGTAQPYSPWCQRFDGEGSGAQCFLPDNNWWRENEEYKITIEKDIELSDGVVWKGTIQNIRTHEEKLIGKIKVSNVKSYKGFGSLVKGSGGFWEYFGGAPIATQCLTAEYSKLIRTRPIADGKWLPERATYRNTNCIRARRYLSPTGTVIEEVGQGVNRLASEPIEGTLWDLPGDQPR